MPPLNIPFAFWFTAAAGGGAPTIADSQVAIDSGGSSGDGLGITFSSAVTAGQYIILIAVSGTNGGNGLFLPTGFTKLYGDDSSYGIFVKKATGSEGASFSVNNFHIAGILIGLKITGVGSTPLDVNAKADSTNTGSSVTTTAANDRLIGVWIDVTASASTMTPPTGYSLLTLGGTQRQFVSGANGGPIVVYVATTTQAAAGASGTQVWTPSTGTAAHVITIAVKPT